MEEDGKKPDRLEQKGDDRQQNYGWGSCAPAGLQVLNSPKAALGFLSCAIFTQGMTVNGLARSVVTTLERRFHLTSTDMGAVLIANDVANFLSSLPISYLGADNKPRWLGCGMLLLAVGALVFALPHFVAEPYRPVPTIPHFVAEPYRPVPTTPHFVAEPYRPVPTTSHFVAEPYRPVPTTSHELCRHSSALTNMSAADSATWEQTGCGNTTDGSDLRMRVTGYKYVLVLGKFLVGTGACALFSLGVTYINENTPPSQSSVYLGVFYSFSIVGPAVGYLLAGAFLTIPTENTFPANIGPDDPHWVGAWWVGFLLTATLAVVAAIFILGLPRRLPSKDESSSSEDSPLSVNMTEASLEGTQQNGDKNGDSGHVQLPSATAPPVQNGGRSSVLRDVSDKSGGLLRNRAFVFLSMATVTEKALFAGIATFTAKYIENQFRTTAGEAALLMGVVSVPGATVGTLLGGYLVKKLRLQVRGIVQMCAGFTLMAALSSLVFLITCQDVPLAGVNVAYHNSSHRPSSVRLEDGCNARCGCSRDQYHPVCGSDGLVYFSPCLAGCQERELNSTSGALLYANCTCVTPGGLVVPGRCPVSCPLEPLFLTVLFFTSVLMFITMIPLLTATLRVVTEEDGPFATGVQDVMVRGLGFIPSILLVGSVIDRACVLQASPCSNGGSCLLYNNREFDVYLVAVCLAYKAASLLFYAVVLLFGQSHEHVDYRSI